MRRLFVAVAVVVAAIVALAVVAHRRSDDRGSMVPAGPGPSADAAPAVSSDADATSSTSSQDVAAGDVGDRVAVARRAGVAAVARTAEVFRAGFISRQDLIAGLATTRYAPVLAERTSRQVMDLLFGLRQQTGHQVDVSLVAQPVTAIASMQPDGRVAVDVWTVAVFVADSAATAPEQWLTVHLQLAWESGHWLVDDWETAAGPAPMPPADGNFGSTDDIAKTIAWPPAGVGGD